MLSQESCFWMAIAVWFTMSAILNLKMPATIMIHTTHTPTLYSRSSHINEQCFCYNYDLVVLDQAIIFIFHDISRFEFQDGCHKRLILH